MDVFFFALLFSRCLFFFFFFSFFFASFFLFFRLAAALFHLTMTDTQTYMTDMYVHHNVNHVRLYALKIAATLRKYEARTYEQCKASPELCTEPPPASQNEL